MNPTRLPRLTMKTLTTFAAGALLSIGAAAHTSGADDTLSVPSDTRLRQPTAPMLAAVRGLRLPTPTESRLLQARPQASLPYDCSVDFSDFNALNAIPEQAYATAGPPWWFQSCGGSFGNYAVVRPLVYGHMHVGFEDRTISCLSSNGTFGREQPDGICSPNGITHVLEPRYVSSHWGNEQLHLYVVNQYTNPKDPYSDSTHDKKPFDFKRLRVLSTPVRVCYKKVQEVAGPWIASPDVHQSGSTPGVWLCWNQLSAGLWDLSAFATHVREVKITATDGISAFEIDDILIGVQ